MLVLLYMRSSVSVVVSAVVVSRMWRALGRLRWRKKGVRLGSLGEKLLVFESPEPERLSILFTAGMQAQTRQMVTSAVLVVVVVSDG